MDTNKDKKKVKKPAKKKAKRKTPRYCHCDHDVGIMLQSYDPCVREFERELLS